MSYLKGLTSKDVIVSPLTVHKTHTYSTISSKTLSLTGLAQFDGNEDTYITGSNTGSAPLVYNSIKQLYYGNYINNSNGLLNTASRTQYNEDGTVEGPVLNNLYENNISSIDEIRKFPPASRAIKVLSIPRAVCGDFIKPGSFDSQYFNEDGEGNLIKKSDSTKVGNIIYGAGVVISDASQVFNNPTFKSSYTLYETQYKCTIEASEFNFSMNPSLLSGSINKQGKIRGSGSAFYADYVTGEDFTPFVTTVGLYNDKKELMAVGKLAQPLALSQHVDTTILVNLDR
jgi:hypothetical protein